MHAWAGMFKHIDSSPQPIFVSFKRLYYRAALRVLSLMGSSHELDASATSIIIMLGSFLPF